MRFLRWDGERSLLDEKIEGFVRLKTTPKAACEHLIKLLDRAVADADNNFGMDKEKLYVSECFVTPGMTLKRIMPRGKGSADRIMKRTSHTTIAVAERE